MAKFKRFDPRNKKAGSHKQKVKNGFNFKRIKNIESKKDNLDYETEDIPTRTS